PGTAYVLLHDHASEESGGGVRTWGFVRGGMGEVTRLMAEAAREAGAEIRCDAEVERIVTTDGRATQVLLADGSEVSAGRVLSNADPKRTFEGLLAEDDVPEEFLSAIRAYRCIGTSIKINLAVSELPQATGVDDGLDYHGGVMEISSPLIDMDRAQGLALRG